MFVMNFTRFLFIFCAFVVLVWPEQAFAQVKKNPSTTTTPQPLIKNPATSTPAAGQKAATPGQQKPAVATPGEKVELLPGAETLEVLKINGVEVRKVKNNVRFRQKDVYLYCDSAFMYPVTNSIEAFSNVRITQGDTVTLTGDSLYYDGNTRYAKVRGNVVLQDRSMTLTSTSLDYDMNTSVAAYYNNGRIVDKENVLTSRQGFYNTRTKLFTFKQDVKVLNPKYEVSSDTLQYSSTSRLVYLKGPSTIVGKDGGTLYANEGTYNTATHVSNFQSRAMVDYGKYTLTANRLYYDQKNDAGFAEGNVESFSKVDNITVYGDFGRYAGRTGITKVYGKALMKNISGPGDTLYLAADTLVSIDPKKDTTAKVPTKKVLGFPNVQIFKADLQGKCDSLVYNFADSTIYFYRDPVMWSGGSQMEADSMHVQLANNKIDKLFLRVNSFVISEDSLRNYNQIKGKTLTALFNAKSKIERVNVDGNGESLYFALDDKDSLLIGMNKVQCSKMVIRFVQNKVNKISFITKPDALFIPPHEIEEPDRRLKGFLWRIKEKPSEEEVVHRRRNREWKVDKPLEKTTLQRVRKRAKSD
jgi:lipopolysaccharide export system protein LptA